MSEPKKDPFECLNPFRKLRKNTATDTVRPADKSPVGALISVSTMSSNDLDLPPSAATPQLQQQPLKQPKSPSGHKRPDPDHTPWTRRHGNQESPLYRKSLIGLRPYSPPPTGGMPGDMKIPHGLENPATKKEKGPDGLKEEIQGKPGDGKERGSPVKDGKGEIITDDGDKNWVDIETIREKHTLDPEILAAPIINLVLDHEDISGHDEKITFPVHRPLLEKSSLLWACLGPETKEIILDHRLKPYAVDAIIQFFYTAELDISHKFGTVEDQEGDFEKLTSVEWTCCYLGVPSCREVTFQRIENTYRFFEFGYNPIAAEMRIKMTQWIYGLNEEYIESGGWVHRMRRRVLAGWCRDISSMESDTKLRAVFEDILTDYPHFSFDLEDFLTERAEEEPKMKSRLDAFKRAEKTGKERFDRQRAFMFPGVTSHPSRLQLPSIRPQKAMHQLPIFPSGRPSTTTAPEKPEVLSTFALSANAPSFNPSAPISPDDALGNKTPAHMPDSGPEEPPQRKRVSRIADINDGARAPGSMS